MIQQPLNEWMNEQYKPLFPFFRLPAFHDARICSGWCLSNLSLSSHPPSLPSDFLLCLSLGSIPAIAPHEISSWEGFRLFRWGWAGWKGLAFQILPWRFDKTTSLKIQELRMVASSGLSIGVNWVGTDEFPGFKFWSKLCAFQQVTSPLCASFYSWVKWRQ